MKFLPVDALPSSGCTPLRNPSLSMIVWAQAISLALVVSAPTASHAADGKLTRAAKPSAAKKAPPMRVRHAVRSDADPDLVTYGRRADVMQFAADVAARQGLDVEAVQAALAQSRFVPDVVKFIMPPPTGTAKNWAAYRARFIEPRRISAGVAFWRANESWLMLAEQRYGVPPEIVVGIVGVETLYGRHMGGFRVIDALATLSFDFPTERKDRSAFFRDELEQLLVMSQREGRDPLTVKGSYAGALGMPQFMPSSVNKYAIDFDGDGHIDLHGNAADVIGSVARYLAEFSWQHDLPTHFEVTAPSDPGARALLLGPDIVPTFTPEQFIGHGAVFGAIAPTGAASGAGTGHDGENAPTDVGLLALVELQNGDDAPSHVAGTANFYAITRYNWSSYYAMAVIELGRAVRRARPPG
ncbi:MAG: lytic murein transglycosylase B [Burkholderiaceae bacterium]|nr:lytic murein transglycosylase B [Burkholderiaceae bacterium]